VRLRREQLAALDAWILDQPPPRPARAEAIHILSGRARCGLLTPRDELMHLVGRLDALAEIQHAVAERPDLLDQQRFVDWLTTAVGDVVQEMDGLDLRAE